MDRSAVGAAEEKLRGALARAEAEEVASAEAEAREQVRAEPQP